MRCSRALPTVAYANSTKPRTKKVVSYCTAFMKVCERDNGIEVEFCRRHFGHEEEPALLTMDPASEAFIISLLKEGFKYSQVLRKVRESCRTSDAMHTRLYYTTIRDIRTIAIRNKVDPARRNEVDTESVDIRVRENNVNDGIRLYIPAKDNSGDEFLLGFFRMTENEVAVLFEEIKKTIPTFETSFFMSDDTNTFFNGFRKVFPESRAKKLLCTFHITQAVERYTRKMKQVKERVQLFYKQLLAIFPEELCLERCCQSFRVV
ncbi:hypothetical protein OESDEN_22513 [Oesophagostomum dentatum]|uniref:MULE transposase domain-containing protein n=1 Tax=Oesophagostomum dentatum TaxID=61180 RepID=A0A0B1S300_OESDE|nr:hypothetical protein OESDEN_22513 [Oesophagostomum dentatum]